MDISKIIRKIHEKGKEKTVTKSNAIVKLTQHHIPSPKQPYQRHKLVDRGGLHQIIRYSLNSHAYNRDFNRMTLLLARWPLQNPAVPGWLVRHDKTALNISAFCYSSSLCTSPTSDTAKIPILSQRVSSGLEPADGETNKRAGSNCFSVEKRTTTLNSTRLHMLCLDCTRMKTRRHIGVISCYCDFVDRCWRCLGLWVFPREVVSFKQKSFSGPLLQANDIRFQQ